MTLRDILLELWEWTLEAAGMTVVTAWLAGYEMRHAASRFVVGPYGP